MARIVIVDDDPSLLKALPEAVRLRLKDVAVDTCDSAADALSKISVTDYDAIVADIKMPGMDGLALLAEIRTLRPDTPTVLITGHGHDDLAVLALRGGAYDFVQKPIDRDYIVASLTRAIEERERRRRVEAQQAFLEQHAELLEKIIEERTRELREANRLKDQFIAMLSHELRSPLGAIRMWASLLRGGKLDAERTARAIEAIERSAMTQAQLVEDLLDVSRITAGKLVLDARPIDLAAVAEAALDAVRADAEAKEVRIEQVFELGGGRVQGDPARLQQVMWNLLSNAVKFSSRGGRVVLRLACGDGQAIISVRDEGEGIAPEFLPHVFEPFRQADSTDTRAHGGLGLGLAIVHDVVELHRGTIEVESKGKGQGATFTVRLPLVGARSEAARGVARQPALSGEEFRPSPSLQGVRVLVVDDDAGARESVTAVLEQSGASVRAVESAAEAVETLEREPPDVLLSDIAMPGMDGYAFLGQARARLPGAQLPAAALTAYADATDRARALAAGFQAHLAKPVDPAELVAVVAELAYPTREPLTAGP
ncbi:MAG: hybrid sensor histidine kinase/response regulator [Candidatus Rokuibacteriota bacterium]|nr:MAG: hybrid sensor histidine kinase/response regulator [Candidatus Rokubacteria bacterium]